MKIIFYFTLLLIAFPIYAQKKTYLDENFKKLGSSQNAIYYNTFENKESSRKNTRTTYYINDSIKNIAHYSDYPNRILDGKFEERFQNGKTESISFYVNGKEDGKSLRYYENGQLKRSDNYSNGVFTDGKCFNENGSEIPFFPYKTPPNYPGGVSEFYKYIGQNYKCKDKGKGVIQISFFVETDGTIRDMKILEGINYELNKEALRVLYYCPNWIPATIDGKIVRALYKLPITIK
jgi:antitoxin component YwqK of YwqJK toxin-antitoxin module